MRHNPKNVLRSSSDALQMRSFQAPNLIVFTRAQKPPIPTLAKDEGEDERPGEQEPVKGRKQALRGMSAKSSLNFARVLSCLDWDKYGECLHVTLTYHLEWPKTKERLYAAKNALCTSVANHFECGFWRLEFQSRKRPTPHKVPHWHLLIWLGSRDGEYPEEYVERRDMAVAWLCQWWAKFSKNDSRHGTHFTYGDQARGRWYLAMHAAKREQSPPFAVGRWWGYISRTKILKALDVHDTGVVFERERVWWARLYRRATGGRTRNSGGFSWFLPNAQQWKAGAWIRDHVEAERERRHREKDSF